MPDALTETTARLKELVAQIMSEETPEKFDEVADEIWRVLDEGDRILGLVMPHITSSR